MLRLTKVWLQSLSVQSAAVLSCSVHVAHTWFGFENIVVCYAGFLCINHASNVPLSAGDNFTQLQDPRRHHCSCVCRLCPRRIALNKKRRSSSTNLVDLEEWAYREQVGCIAMRDVST